MRSSNPLFSGYAKTYSTGLTVAPASTERSRTAAHVSTTTAEERLREMRIRDWCREKRESDQ